jgi:LmbE family N-acetylglucosaminyl deacetylase
VQLVVDNEHLGTSEFQWRTSTRLESLEPLERITAKRIIVVAPHPDDEVFGAGGIIQHARNRHIEVAVLAVTDGESCYPFSDASAHRELARRRECESREALRRLGWAEPVIERLHLSDGDVAARREELEERLTGSLRPGDWCVAPWSFEGHPDHDACGVAALGACRATGARMLSYLVWTWHWATPQDVSIPWHRFKRLELSRREAARKRWASMAFESQTSPRGVSSEPVLPAPLLRRFWRRYEIYVDETGRSL